MYYLIYNGTLIDVNGKENLDNAHVLVENNRIIGVGDEDSIRLPNEKIMKINADKGYILPGFIDTHSHVMWDDFHPQDNVFTPLSLYFYKAVQNLWKTINAGVTTVRDAGLADYGVKQAVEERILIGPRLQISVMPLSITGGHFDFHMKSGFDVGCYYPGLPHPICDGISGVRKKVREVLRAGAEVLKVMVTGGVMSANDSPIHPQFTLEELEIMVEEASFRDVKVMAHAHGLSGIKNALNAGINSIEHGSYLDRECQKLIIKKGAWLVPTLIVTQFNLSKAKSGNMPDYSKDHAFEVAEVVKKNMTHAYKAGVPMVMGTDCGIVPHGHNLQELNLLCKLGMSPLEAIQAGTIKAAECLGWQDKIGSIENGKLADIIISKINPLSDIKSLGYPDNISLVMKEGQIIKRI